MKTCTKCNTEQPYDSYSKHKGFRDGYRSQCKACTNSIQRKWYLNNREIHIHRASDWNRRNKDKVAGYAAKSYENGKDNAIAWRAKNPERTAAHQRLAYAVYTGVVEPSKCCTICGCDDQKIQGHHYDYSKPLAVTWVCIPCHRWIHKKSRYDEAMAKRATLNQEQASTVD